MRPPGFEVLLDPGIVPGAFRRLQQDVQRRIELVPGAFQVTQTQLLLAGLKMTIRTAMRKTGSSRARVAGATTATSAGAAGETATLVPFPEAQPVISSARPAAADGRSVCLGMPPESEPEA